MDDATPKHTWRPRASPSESDRVFGKTIRQERQRRHLTQQNLVDMVYLKGVPFSQPWLSTIENGHVAIGDIKVELVQTICLILKMDIQDFVTNIPTVEE